MSEENKTLVRRALEEITINGPDAMDRFYASNFLYHGTKGTRGLQEIKQLPGYFQPFSNLQITVEDTIAEGDMVVARFSLTFSHTGDYMGVAQTGRQVRISGITMARIQGGMIVEEWKRIDEMGIMQQLGVIA